MYFQVNKWMIKYLELKGIELQVFAIIYGFTRDGRTEFNGSINYIKDLLCISRRSVSYAIKKLAEDNLIYKNTAKAKNGGYINNSYFSLVDYDEKNERIVWLRGTEEPLCKNCTTLCKNCTTPYAKIAPPPLYIYNNNNKENIKESSEHEVSAIASTSSTLLKSDSVNGKAQTSQRIDSEDVIGRGLRPLNTMKKKKENCSGQKKEKKDGAKALEDKFISAYNKARSELLPSSRGIRLLDAKTKRQLTAAAKNGYSVDELVSVFKHAAKEDHHKKSKYKWLTPEFITRQDKINMYLDVEEQTEKNINGDFDYIPFDYES